MRSVIALSALMATAALAKPLEHQHQHAHAKRQDVVIVTDVEIAYVTQYVTAYAGDDVAETSTSAAPAATSSAFVAPVQDWGFGWWTRRKTSTTSTSIAPTTTKTKTTATSTPAVILTSPTSTIAPVPTTTSTPPAAVTSTTLRTSTIATSTPKPVTSTTPATTSVAAPAATGYAAMALAHHNVHRANHSSPAAVWNTTLASIALDIANSCNYAHNTAAGGGGYGQNIAAGAPASQVTNVISDLFYNGEVNWFNGLYGAANPDMSNFEHWGHFSQIVWAQSTSVGCATVDCSAKGLANTGSNVPPYFTVCNYYPAGNMGGGYGANIGASLNRATVKGTDNV